MQFSAQPAILPSPQSHYLCNFSHNPRIHANFTNNYSRSFAEISGCCKDSESLLGDNPGVFMRRQMSSLAILWALTIITLLPIHSSAHAAADRQPVIVIPGMAGSEFTAAS